MTEHAPPHLRPPALMARTAATRRIYAGLLVLLLGPAYVLAYAVIGDRTHGDIRWPDYNYAVGAYDSPVEFASWAIAAAAVGGSVIIGAQSLLVLQGRLKSVWLNAIPPVVGIAVVLAWLGRMLTLGGRGASFIVLAFPMAGLPIAVFTAWLACVVARCARQDREVAAVDAVATRRMLRS